MNPFKTFFEDICWMYEQKLVLEMANMQPEDTGLHPIVHVMSKGGAKHWPRVKVSNIVGRFAHDDNFSVTAEDTPRVVGVCKIKKQHLNDIIDWVKLNKEHIHKVWHEGDKMSPSKIEAGFKKLTP